MKTGLVRNIPVTEGEVTIVKADTAQEIMEHSCKLAAEIREAGVGVLVVNTGLSGRRFKQAAAQSGIEWQATRNSSTVVATGKTPIVIHTSEAGDLVSELPNLTTICQETGTKIVIITSWEWTSSGARRKERLLYALRTLMNEENVSVIIYTQSTTGTTSGRYDRGGTGRLATIAYDVIALEAAETIGTPKTDLNAFGATEFFEQPQSASAQLVSKEINTLQGKIVETSAKEKGQGERGKAKGEFERSMALAA